MSKNCKAMEEKIFKIGTHLKQGTITESEAKRALLVLLGVSISLQDDAKECLTALSYWDENEFKDAILPHHQLKGMRPMILTKKLLNVISNEC
jgi:hypothetical protein